MKINISIEFLFLNVVGPITHQLNTALCDLLSISYVTTNQLSQILNIHNYTVILRTNNFILIYIFIKTKHKYHNGFVDCGLAAPFCCRRGVLGGVFYDFLIK